MPNIRANPLNSYGEIPKKKQSGYVNGLAVLIHGIKKEIFAVKFVGTGYL